MTQLQNEIPPPSLQPPDVLPGTQEFVLDLPEPYVPQTLEDGRVRNLLRLDERDFSIKPIARRLAKINRYAGASAHPYSVAAHSLLVSRLIEAEPERYLGSTGLVAQRNVAYQALMHDATEAFGIGDLIRPVKTLCPEYNSLENSIWEQIKEPLALVEDKMGIIKRADERAYQLESKYLMGWFPEPHRTRFEPWAVSGAEHEAALFYVRQEFYWKDAARLLIQAFERLAPAAVLERCL